MIPEYPKFKALELSDRNVIAKYLSEHGRSICELALGNLFIWSDFDRPELTRINDNLCIMINPLNEAPFFLEPVGSNRLRQTAETCLAHTGKISRATRPFCEMLGDRGCAITPLRNHFDYVYRTKELAELKGKKFDGKRNHLRKFRAANPDYKFTAVSAPMKDEALALFEKWFEIRKESRFFPRLAHKYQRAALERAFSLYNELSLIGGAIFSEGRMKGFMIGSRLNAETVSAHFSYGDPTSQGISQALLWEAANRTFRDFELMNMEQDLGIPGLRTAKLSYHPFKLEEKFQIECKM